MKLSFLLFSLFIISRWEISIFHRKAYKKIDKFLSFKVIYKIHIHIVELQKASGVIIYKFNSYGKFDLRLLLCLRQLQKYRDTYHIALPVSWDDIRIVPPYFGAWCICLFVFLFVCFFFCCCFFFFFFFLPARKIPGTWSPCQTDSQLQESYKGNAELYVCFRFPTLPRFLLWP